MTLKVFSCYCYFYYFPNKFKSAQFWQAYSEDFGNYSHGNYFLISYEFYFILKRALQ